MTEKLRPWVGAVLRRYRPVLQDVKIDLVCLLTLSFHRHRFENLIPFFVLKSVSLKFPRACPVGHMQV